MRQSLAGKGLVLTALTLLGSLVGVRGGSSREEASAPPVLVSQTSLLRGPVDRPSGMVEVELVRPLDRPVLTVTSSGQLPRRVELEANEPGHRILLPVPIPPGGDFAPGTDFLLSAEEGGEVHRIFLDLEVPEVGWTLYFVPGFHYDPVWWNTQAHYTETGKGMDAHLGSGLSLVEEYLEMCRAHPEYRVALHQLPYLKTFLEARPGLAPELERAIERRQCGIVGGTYNELSTPLVSAEVTARSAVFGTLFQSEVLGGDGSIFWQCDVFGHDPMFPSLMERSGHRAGVFGRGPFHQWGAPRDQVNFPSEFYWMAPDGRKLLTHYMTGHYGYAYERFASGQNRASEDPAVQALIIHEMFEDLKQVSLTPNLLLPMHMDFVRPLTNLPEIVRVWNETYLSPVAVIDDGSRFFAAVRKEIQDRDLPVPVITRDMNPIYTGCAVSLADLKLAQRECESVLRDAEIYSTLAALEGARYPSLALDRAWRQLLFNAHHDSVTGSQSDQVYLDTLHGYRDAFDLAREVKSRALSYLSGKISTAGLGDLAPSQSPRPKALVVWNSLSSPREGWVELESDETEIDSGVEGQRRNHGHRELFVPDLPAVGYQSYDIPDSLRSESASGSKSQPKLKSGFESDSGLELGDGVPDAEPRTLENEALRLVFDPARGGTLTSLVDKRSGREFLRGPGNEVVLLEEYPILPGHGEGPWHLSPTGKRTPGREVVARVLPQDPSRPGRLVFESTHELFELRQTIVLRPGTRRIDFTTEVLNWKGRNQLLRIEFPLDLPGGLPVYETAGSVIGRPFALDVDTAESSWTLDQSCWQWIDFGSCCSVEGIEAGKTGLRRALGVGEIVVGSSVPKSRIEEANRLAEALVKCGVTTTLTSEKDRRYGDLRYDSNRPDFRLYFGKAREHRLIRELLDEGALPSRSEGPVFLEERTPDSLPILIVRPGPELFGVVESLVRDQRIFVSQENWISSPRTQADENPRRSPFPRFGVALINRGSVSARITEDGTLGLHLLRSCTSWPSGIWIDPPDRRLPDGSPFGTMHGSHVFHYSLLPHEGDFREAGLAFRGQEVNQPLAVRREPKRVGSLPSRASFFEVEPRDVLLSALKLEGFDEPRWELPVEETDSNPNRVVLRLWNGSGRAALSKISSRYRILRARLGDLLESEVPPGESSESAFSGVELEVAREEGEVRVALEPNAYETVILEVEPRRRDPRAPDLDPTTGDVSPSAYWLENLGEGVTGFGVFSIAPREREITLGDEIARTTIDLVNHRRTRALPVRLRVEKPEGVEVDLEPETVVLAPGEAREVEVTLRARRPLQGKALLSFFGRGVGLRSVSAAIWLLPEQEGRSSASVGAGSPVLNVEVSPSIVSRGGTLRARISNRSEGPISGMASWISPVSLWPHLEDWRRSVKIGPKSTVEIRSELGAEALDSYAILKFTYGGKILYSEPIAVVSDPKEVVLSFGVDRVRLSPKEPTIIEVIGKSLKGLTASSQAELIAPPEWRIRPAGYRFQWDELGVSTKNFLFSVLPGGRASRGQLTGIGPSGSRAPVEFSVAPRQRAHLGLGDVTVDGDLSEWLPVEFTEAKGDLGVVRCAVRYGASGLALAFEVEDEFFRQTKDGAKIWEGDSVQFALSLSPSSALGYRGTDLEFGAARTGAGATLWCWYAGEDGATGLVSEGRVAVTGGAGRMTRYEMSVPRSRLPKVVLAPGTVLGFSYIANDDDGEGYRGATQWTGGMVGAKDSSLFGELELGRVRAE